MNEEIKAVADRLVGLREIMDVSVEEAAGVCGISIEHAFNRKGDKYFDITWELALNDKTDGVEYLSIGEYSQETINRIAIENEVYGDIVRSIFLKQKSNKPLWHVK